MNRIVLTAAVALLILWQSNCLEFRDGGIINRCGLWQFFTGNLVILSVGESSKLVKLPTSTEILPPRQMAITPLTLVPYDYGCYNATTSITIPYSTTGTTSVV